MFRFNKQSKPLTLFMATAVAFGSLFSTANAGHHKEKEMTTVNIVETAKAAGQFNTLLAAAGAAGLADTLANDGPFTVFAPTDDAFAALPAGTVESLLKPENKDKLASILKFHVLSGKVGSGALADGIAVDTLAGVAAGIAAKGDGFTIAGANIVATDIAASNGVIHVIDAVILPPEPTASNRATLNPALDIIDTAIDSGVPMFNHGNAAATAAIYTVAARSLLNFADAAELPASSRQRLDDSISQAMRQTDARQQAWTLRYALDDVRAALTQNNLRMASNR